MKKLAKFLRLPTAEKFLLLRTVILVAAIRLGLWVLPFRVVQRFTFKARKTKQTKYSVEQFIWAVRATSRYVPRATCLTQAMAAQALLLRAGYTPKVKIGVAKNDKKLFEAHAWLVLGDQVLIGGTEVERYTALTVFEEGH
nr:lasso peptide biosynthesis B2 protein [Candidatus Acidoferrales bacterium]